ncbi:hypothetical protein [Candidatus Aquicultor sp.]
MRDTSTSLGIVSRNERKEGATNATEKKKFMHVNDIAKLILDCAFKIHKEVGPGLLINCNVSLLKDGIVRIVNKLDA